MRSLLASGLVSAAVLLASRPGAAAPTFPAGPYLQSLSSSGVEIRVQLDAAAPATLEVTGAPDKKRVLDDPARAFHVFRVDGLAPQTTYRYVVRSGARTSPEGTFVTAPPDGSAAPFAFVLYGDTRTNADVHASVVRAIGRQSFDFLVGTGDMVAAGGDRPEWRELFSIEADLLRDHCVFACVGNHELVDDEAATTFLTYFGASEPGDGGPAPLYRSFRWASARFFVLNAFQDWGKGELAWLERELTKADAEPGLRTRFVVVHHSPYSSGRHGDDARMLAAGVPDLLVRHHIDLVLAGHDHIYERGEWKGLKYLVSGGGGAPLYPEITAKPSTRRAEATHHFVRISVDGDAVKMVALRADGSTLEACGFQRGQSWDCDAPAASPSARPTPPTSAAPPAPPGSDGGGGGSRCGCDLPGRGAPRGLLPALAGVALALARRRRRAATPG